MANFGVVEMHAWTSPITAPDRPSYALIDLDPGTTTTFDDLVTLALLHRTALEHLGVTAQPKVTGQRGIQIWVPVEPGPTFEDTRVWVEKVSRGGRYGPRSRELGGNTQVTQGPRPTRYTQNGQQDAGRAYSVRQHRRPCRCRSRGRARRL
jgi:DNA primase